MLRGAVGQSVYSFLKLVLQSTSRSFSRTSSDPASVDKLMWSPRIRWQMLSCLRMWSPRLKLAVRRPFLWCDAAAAGALESPCKARWYLVQFGAEFIQPHWLAGREVSLHRMCAAPLTYATKCLSDTLDSTFPPSATYGKWLLLMSWGCFHVDGFSGLGKKAPSSARPVPRCKSLWVLGVKRVVQLLAKHPTVRNIVVPQIVTGTTRNLSKSSPYIHVPALD